MKNTKTKLLVFFIASFFLLNLVGTTEIKALDIIPDFVVSTSCEDLGGECCDAGLACGGTVVSGTDCVTVCCDGSCSSSITPTCQNQGYTCCDSCQAGQQRSAYDDDCPEVCCKHCLTGGLANPPIRVEIKNPLKTANFAKIIENVLMWSLSIVGSLALLVLILGGVIYIGSTGDEQRVVTAKKIIVYALIGLILILVSYSVVVVLGGILS